MEGVLALSYLNLSNLKILVIELVVPIFSYWAGIWGFNKDGPAEKNYNKAL